MAAALLADAPSAAQLQLTRFVILRNGCDECAASTLCGFGGVRLIYVYISVVHRGENNDRWLEVAFFANRQALHIPSEVL